MKEIHKGQRSGLNQANPGQWILGDAIMEIIAKLNSPLDITTLLEHFLQQINRIIPYTAANVFLIDNSHVKLLCAVNNEAIDNSNVDQIPLNGSDIHQIPYVKESIQTGNHFLTKIQHHQERSGSSPIYRYWAGVPVKSQGETIGFITLSSPHHDFLTEDHSAALTTFAGLISVKLENMRLLEALQARDEREENARARIVQSEKLAALGRIVASVAHELNNPLQAIQNALYLISLEESLSPQSREDIQVALTESNRMAGLIARLRETYRPMSNEEYQYCSINNLVLDVEKLIATHLRHNNVQFNFLPGSELPQCFVIQDQIKQVILNICLNAVESMHRGGELEVQTKYDSNMNRIELIFSDNGPGIHPEILPNIFDPFITTKEGGTGLGLSITYDIVQRHGGMIDVESQLGKGTKFSVSIPIKH